MLRHKVHRMAPHLLDGLHERGEVGGGVGAQHEVVVGQFASAQSQNAIVPDDEHSLALRTCREPRLDLVELAHVASVVGGAGRGRKWSG
jgi:hypothetical protein